MLLSHASKMPDASFSLEAWKTCPTANRVSTAPNAICQGCYARKGFYCYPNVKNAQRERLDFVMRSIREDGGDTFVSAMIGEIRKEKTKYFRIHDSGDMFSAAYVDCWLRICTALPDTKFWCPTREWKTNDSHKLSKLKALAKLPNVALRPSAIHFNDPAPMVKGFAAGSTAITKIGKEKEIGCGLCPTAREENPDSCAKNGCFACWDKASAPVAFLKH